MTNTVVAGLLAVLLLAAACGQDQAVETPAEEGRSVPASGDVAALLEQAPARDFHVEYESSGADGPLRQAATNAAPAFAWREADGTTAEERTFAQHYFQESDGSVVGCIWVGETASDDIDEWECARHQPAEGEPGLFDTFFGALLFDAEVYAPADVASQGWEHARTAEYVGREALCGSSPAFAEGVEEVCIDAEDGIPLAVERDGQAIAAVELREPRDEDLTPPAEPWDAGDGGG